MTDIFKKLRHIVMSPDVMFFASIWMMVLLVAGTVAQKYIGLYQAQHLFFSNWVLWVGFVPLPGGLAAMGTMTLALTGKLIFKSPWHFKNSGSIITHIGALLLLYGGLLTSVNSTEGNMVIYEGDASNYISDYHVREFVVRDDKGEPLFAQPFENLRTGDTFEVPDTSLKIEILKTCRNCDVFKRANEPTANLRNKAEELDIRPAALSLGDETNKSGIEFRISDSDSHSNGTWLSLDFLDDEPHISVQGKNYVVALEKKRTYLPFVITLEKFNKQYHPGTNTARSYESNVVVKDGDAHWRSVIRMNEPMRYKGYTFYQASFIDGDKKQASVLSVVKNAGRAFPYISGVVMCVGLLVVILTKLPNVMRRFK